MAEDEEIYDDIGVAIEDKSMSDFAARKAMFGGAGSGGNAQPVIKPKPGGLTPKPKYGGGGMLNIVGVENKSDIPGVSKPGNVRRPSSNEDTKLRDKSPDAANIPNGSVKRDSKNIDIPAAFLQNSGIGKPSPLPKTQKPMLGAKPGKLKNDNNNNAKPEESSPKSPVTKKPSVGKSSPRGLQSGSVGGIANVFGGLSPSDIKQGLKHVPKTSEPGVSKPEPASKPSIPPWKQALAEAKEAKAGGDVELRNRWSGARSSNKRKSVKTMIRKVDGKIFNMVGVDSLESCGDAPEKPAKLDLEIDWDSLKQDFRSRKQAIGRENPKDHQCEEVEELYDDCGNLESKTSRVVSLIPEISEEEEQEWAKEGFPGFPDGKLPPPPAALLEGPTEDYEDAQVVDAPPQPDVDPEDGEMYEFLPDEADPGVEDAPPPAGPKPKTSVSDKPPEPPPIEKIEEAKKRDAKELEKEKKRKEKEEKKLKQQKEKEMQQREKELKDMQKKYKIDAAVLASSVGKGTVKETMKAKDKLCLAVQQGDTVDIIRMVDNAKGKFLVRIHSSQKENTSQEAFNPSDKIGYVESSNVEMMENPATTPTASDAPQLEEQETYEDVEGNGQEPELIEEDIYEECS